MTQGIVWVNFFMEEVGIWEQGFKEDPDSTLFAPLADSYEKTGRLREAIGLLEQGLRKHPLYLPGHLLLGRYYKKEGRYQEAREEFDKVIILDKGNVPAYRELADIYEKLEDRDKLTQTYKTILMLYSYDERAREYMKKEKKTTPFATFGIAQLYESQGLLKEALKIYKEILKKEPDNEEAKRKIEELRGYEG